MKKNFFNKGLALLLCLSMCMGLLQTTALAATYVGGELVCGQTAHTHTDACYADEPQCGQTAHTHDEVCQGGLKYAELVCTIPEGHEHSDDCMVFPTTEEQQLVCKLEEHDHGTAGCTLNSEETWSCNNEHGHIAGCPEGCARVHEHTEDCPEDCTQVHEHIVGCPADCGVIHHTSECTCDVVETWSCGLDNHTHEDACYETVEIPDETQEKVCSLGVKDEDQNHTHGEACYERKTEEGHDCPLQEHEHTAACYFTCAGTEHTHTDACYEANSDGEQAIWDALQNALNSSGDDDIVLIVGGKTITTSGDTGIKVTGNKNLTIANGNGETVGTITANGEEGHRVVTILNGGTVNLIGNVTLTGGNADAGGGGGVFVHGSNSTLNMSAGSISGNTSTASGGGVIVKKGAEFNMYGGTITGNEAQGVNGNGGGVAVNDGTFNMYGGTISDNKTNLDAGDSYEIKQGEKDPMYGRPNSQGGGVYVENGQFNLKGGTISGNESGEGGGIFIGKDGNLQMTGGKVIENIAHVGEGGGIYIYGGGTGKITAGKILDNTTHTTNDLGGGGIYIEVDGELTLKNAIITNNTANGLGGGLAACVHGKTIVYVTEGAAIFGNSAEGNSSSKGHSSDGGKTWNGNLIDGHDQWQGNKDFIQNAQDVFAASNSAEKNGGGIVIGADMLGGGDANWYGFMFKYNENGMLAYKDKTTGETVYLEAEDKGVLKLDGKVLSEDDLANYEPDWELVTTDETGSLVHADRFLGATAAPDQSAVDAAAAAAILATNYVLISGNHSDTHGGGIGNNGTLKIGEGPFVGDAEKTEDQNIHKDLTSQEPDNENAIDRPLKDQEFSFDLCDKDGNVLDTVKHDKFGNAGFNFPAEIFTKAGTYTFIVKENMSVKDPSVDYDLSEYKIVIVIEEKEEEPLEDENGEQILVGGTPIMVTTLEVVSTTIYKIKDAAGNDLVPAEDVTETGISFNNTYKPEEYKGSLTIRKVDGSTGEGLAGAKFLVTGPDNYSAEVTTGEDGTATLTGLTFGIYTVEEIEAPEDYEANTAPIEVKVEKDTAGTAAKFTTIANSKENGGLVINKKDGEGNALAGAEFSITNGTVTVGPFTTDDSGVIRVQGLTPGTYTVTETKAPDGYKLSGQSQPVVVKAGAAAAASVDFVNEAEVGSIVITKTDSETGELLSGATFRVSGTSTSGKAVSEERTTGADGVARFENLPVGTYTVEEVSAPTGYAIDVKTYDGVEVTDGVETPLSVTNTRIKGSLTIRKVDSKTGAALAGAIFTVTGPNGYNSEVTTGEDGTVTLNDLIPGTYTVTETRAPAGYLLDSSSHPVTVVGGRTADIEISNDPVTPPPPTTPDPEEPDDPTPETPDKPTPETPDEPSTPNEPVPNEPETPDEPETTDEQDLPDEETPLAEIPESPMEEMELPEEEVPLAELPENLPEEIELPESEIPLGDVPKTGDVTGLWHVLGVLAAGALALLKLLERKEREAE